MVYLFHNLLNQPKCQTAHAPGKWHYAKQVLRREGGSTDTAHDHEYTDWDAVARFTRQFQEALTQTA